MTYSGSEQVAKLIADTFDIDDIFTFAALPSLEERFFPGRKVSVSWLGRRRMIRDHWQWALPLMPLAWRRVDLNDYDLVVTSSHSCVNAIRVPPRTRVVCYCHTPMRYAWDWRLEVGRLPAVARYVWPAVAYLFRRADKAWSRKVDVFIANCATLRGG